ncbi:MAG TPA: hypothetical protein DEV87_04865 [Clostridiales bacterium]|nr:hypothetical protein [Clostridiales bacterium]
MSLFKRKEVKPAKTKKAKTVAKPAAPKKKTSKTKKTSKSGTSKKPATAKKPAEKKTSKSTSKSGKPKTSATSRKTGSNIGKVYRGRTKYIDKENKLERNYVVVVDDGNNVTISKLKSIKIVDINGKNADKALVEINSTRYGLTKRTGVDFQRFDKNRMSGKELNLKDKDVFPEGKERFKLGSHDTNRAIKHTEKGQKKGDD